MKPRADYRTFQVLSDLHAVASQCDTQHNLFDQNSGALKKQIHTLFQSETFCFDKARISNEMRVALLSIVFGEIQNLDNFTFAIALLLSDQLQGGRGIEEPDHGWGLLQEPIQAISLPRKPAILRGYDRLFKFSNQFDVSAIKATDFLTMTLENTKEALTRLFENPTVAELEFISRADYARESQKHLSALKKVIFHQNGKMNEAESWYPSEVIELISHVPSNWGFTTCTALLLYNDLDIGDSFYGTDFRWANNAQKYLTMDEPAQRIIVNGFRYLFESDQDWDPYAEWPQSKLERAGIAIPYFEE